MATRSALFSDVDRSDFKVCLHLSEVVFHPLEVLVRGVNSRLVKLFTGHVRLEDIHAIESAYTNARPNG